MADLTLLAKGQVSPAIVQSHRAWVSVSILSGINAQCGVAVHLSHEEMEALEATTACHPSGVGAPAAEQIFQASKSAGP